MLLAVVIGYLYAHRTPPKPPHPLAVAVTEVASAAFDGTPLAAGSPGFTTAAALPSKLAATPPLTTAVSWAGTRTLRLTLRDGTTLWLQSMTEAGSAFLRVNADPGAGKPSADRAHAIRALRLSAWRLPADSLAAIPGFNGDSRAPVETNKLIHKNKSGKVN